MNMLYIPIVALGLIAGLSATTTEEVTMSDNSEVAPFGIVGKTAPELRVPLWVDGTGTKMDTPPTVTGKDDQVTVLYCFQSWCPGCHSVGLPSLQKLVSTFEDNDHIQFLAIQTVFEGRGSNTYEKMLETQKKYELPIPFGHDVGDKSTRGRSATMYDYRTGGTPWFIFIDKDGKVIFNDYHLDMEKAIAFLQEQIAS